MSCKVKNNSFVNNVSENSCFLLFFYCYKDTPDARHFYNNNNDKVLKNTFYNIWKSQCFLQ